MGAGAGRRRDQRPVRRAADHLPRCPAASRTRTAVRALLENFGAMGWRVTPGFMRSLSARSPYAASTSTCYHAMWTDPTKSSTRRRSKREPVVARGTAHRLDRPGDELAAGAPRRRPPHPSASAAQPAADPQGDIDTPSPRERRAGGRAGRLRPARRGRAAATRRCACLPGVHDGALRVGPQRYRYAVLPETPTLALAAVHTLTGFVRSGGTLVAVGSRPGRGDRRARRRSAVRAERAVRGTAVPAQVRHRPRRSGSPTPAALGGDVYFANVAAAFP